MSKYRHIRVTACTEDGVLLDSMVVILTPEMEHVRKLVVCGEGSNEELAELTIGRDQGEV